MTAQRVFQSIFIFLTICAILLIGILSGIESSLSQVEYSCVYKNGHVEQCPLNVQPEFHENLSVFARYNNRINETGWAELEVTTNSQMPDADQAYNAGFMEGLLTARLIQSARLNMLEEAKFPWCKNLGQFISNSLNKTVERVLQNPTDPYWQQVGLVIYQLAGLEDAYKTITENQGPDALRGPHLNIDPCGLILFNLITELGDIQSILNQTLITEKTTHCSAIVKLLADNDVLVAHNSWTTFTWMLRIIKRYNFHFTSSAAKSISFSSYPGIIFSIDDFYLTSQNLSIVETSIPNFNDSLWEKVPVDGMVFEFVRNTVANRMATSGAEWAKIYSKFNSGTYNNQFMVVDYKKIGQKEGLLTILEQLPGTIEYADKTSHLLQTSYWSSYNVPYFPAIYKLSGHPEMVKKYGDFYTYDKTARALIFSRDHSKVTNLTSLYHLMRYNDMTHDPLSRCNCTPPYTGEYAIAARNDLNDPTGKYPFRTLSFRPHGAIDAKMTSTKLAKDLQMVAVSGPTDENVPAFSWTRTKIVDQPHLDQPVEWKFQPVQTVWDPKNVFPNFDL